MTGIPPASPLPPASCGASVVIVVRAYEPGPDLVTLLERVQRQCVSAATFVVDDGSSERCRDIFGEIEALPHMTVLRHAVNLGKGAALKTGINAALVRYGPTVSIVTMDADGQHEPSDVRVVCEETLRHPNALVLGTRQFGSDTPLRSRVGNLATGRLLRLLVGLNIADTQTGLRGIPGALAQRLLLLESQRYEFELDMLILCRHLRWPIRQTPISTIYRDNNRSSHFNPVTDSARIYWVLFRFLTASLASAWLDNLLFVTALTGGLGVSASQALARLVSLCVNYLLLRRFVFFSAQRHSRVLPKYLLIVAIWWVTSLILIQVLTGTTSPRVSILQAKIMVESLLFPLNFLIQREWVFRRAGWHPGHAL